MNVLWKSGLVGILSFVLIPVTSYAERIKIQEGEIISIDVGVEVNEPSVPKVAVTLRNSDQKENKAWLFYKICKNPHAVEPILKTLERARAFGRTVSLYNHTNKDTHLFDEVVSQEN